MTEGARMTVPAWDVLAGLPAWQVAELPRRAPRGGEKNGDAAELAAEELDDRMLSLAAACGEGSPVAFGWVREQAEGPVRVIAAGDGMRAEGASARADAEGLVKLGYPSSGARGVALPPGGLAEVFDALSWWVPVAVTPDALLVDEKKNPGDEARRKPHGHGVLRSWDGPFGWVVLAVPIAEDRHSDLLAKASLEQLAAERHDAPRAQQSARRWKARHEEFRQATVHGLWDIWLLAGADDKRDLMRVAGLVASSLHPHGMPFGLMRLKDRQGRLPEVLGALARTDPAPAAKTGPLTSDVLGMFDGQAPGPAPGGPAPGGFQPGPSRWTPGGQPPQQQLDSSGFPVWAPPRPDQGRGGQQPSGASAPGPGGLAPEFPDPEPQFPVAASSRLLAALAVPPSREVPGVRFTLEPDFDVTPETVTGGEGDADGITLGTILDAGRSPAGTVSVPRGSLNRHTFVCGATGAGKSQTVRHMLESATGAGIPWLVIEPAKAEYRLMAARLPDTEVVTIRPGDLSDVPVGINPLEPAAGPDGKRFPLQAHADLVRALFLAAFQADEPFPQVLAAALTKCYTEAGWDMLTGEPSVEGASYPTLADLQRAALEVVDEIGYSREITDNVRGFVSVRIGSLMGGTTGRFLHGGFPLDFGRLLSGNVVMEIEDCGDDTDKAFLTGAVLARLTEYLRLRSRAEGPGPTGLRHLTVVEEAHRLLRRPPEGEGGGPAAHAVEMFAGLLAEIRAYGEGLVIAEQIPSKLIPDVIKNTAVKVVHRLPAQDDRDAVGATMNLTEDQSRYLVTLRPGEAAVFTDGMDYPVLAKMPDGSGRESGTEIRSGYLGGLAGGRSPACPGECRDRACSLGQVAAAQKAAAGMTLWAELAVLGHLTGWPVPVPRPGHLPFPAGMDTRVRDCAIAHAAEAAAKSRTAAMVPRVAPGPLAAHVAAVMRRILDGGGNCQLEPEWLAPLCEWDAVVTELSQSAAGGTAGRHPRSGEWEQSFGRTIPGGSCAEQLAVVREWRDEAWSDVRRRADTAWGTARPSAIETALGGSNTAPDWPRRVADAIGKRFAWGDWALQYLAPGGTDGGAGKDSGADGAAR